MKIKHSLYGVVGAVTALCAALPAAASAATAPPTTFLQKEIAQGGDCRLIVPADPLTAKGLATPYQLANGPNTTGCTMANAANLGAFVQATILEPGGKLASYDPLVVTVGTTPAAPPPVPVIPDGSVVTIDTGFQGNILFLGGLGAGAFVRGLPGSPFGQVAFANGPRFFAAAKAANITVPALGTAADGLPCPTVRDFSLVDQDQSDNVTTTYLVTADGRTALPGSGVTGVTVGNGSDNRLINHFIDPAIGCAGSGFMVPSLSSPGSTEATQATDELLAAAGEKAPVALVPPNDPMVTVGADIDIIPNDFPTAGNLSLLKTDLYRAELGQPPLTADPAQAATQYCKDLKAAGTRVTAEAKLPGEINSPSPQAGTNLATFMLNRYAASISLLNCKLFT